ncbi:MAG: hypothetical protein NVS1B6_03640 [Steroidobacteraceae bacterium]
MLTVASLHAKKNAHSMASLTIAFGLVAIPVKLFSAAVAPEKFSFNGLHRKDGSRVRQRYVANEGELVERGGLAKGYEFAKDQFVMFSPEELRALEDLTTRSIEIAQFDQSIAQLSAGRFEPNGYVDELHNGTEAAIHRKIHGKEVSLGEPPVAPGKGKVIDLVHALKDSLDVRGPKSTQSDERRAARRAIAEKTRKAVRR